MVILPSFLERVFTTEPIVGHREWDLTHSHRLAGIVSRAEWPAGEAVRARCSEHPEHRAPEPDCDCGLYAERELIGWKHPDGRLPSAYGTVALWGRVIEHENGWRAEYAYPLEISLRCADCGLRPTVAILHATWDGQITLLCDRCLAEAPTPRATTGVAEVRDELSRAYAVPVRLAAAEPPAISEDDLLQLLDLAHLRGLVSFRDILRRTVGLREKAWALLDRAQELGLVEARGRSGVETTFGLTRRGEKWRDRKKEEALRKEEREDRAKGPIDMDFRPPTYWSDLSEEDLRLLAEEDRGVEIASIDYDPLDGPVLTVEAVFREEWIEYRALFGGQGDGEEELEATPSRSRRPLSLRELVQLIESVYVPDWGSPVEGYWEWQMDEEGLDVWEAVALPWIRSEFYPELPRYYARRGRRWVARKRREALERERRARREKRAATRSRASRG